MGHLTEFFEINQYVSREIAIFRDRTIEGRRIFGGDTGDQVSDALAPVGQSFVPIELSGVPGITVRATLLYKNAKWAKRLPADFRDDATTFPNEDNVNRAIVDHDALNRQLLIVNNQRRALSRYVGVHITDAEESLSKSAPSNATVPVTSWY